MKDLNSIATKLLDNPTVKAGLAAALGLTIYQSTLDERDISKQSISEIVEAYAYKKDWLNEMELQSADSLTPSNTLGVHYSTNETFVFKNPFLVNDVVTVRASNEPTAYSEQSNIITRVFGDISKKDPYNSTITYNADQVDAMHEFLSQFNSNLTIDDLSFYVLSHESAHAFAHDAVKKDKLVSEISADIAALIYANKLLSPEKFQALASGIYSYRIEKQEADKYHGSFIAIKGITDKIQDNAQLFQFVKQEDIFAISHKIALASISPESVKVFASNLQAFTDDRYLRNKLDSATFTNIQQVTKEVNLETIVGLKDSQSNEQLSREINTILLEAGYEPSKPSINEVFTTTTPSVKPNITMSL